MRKTNRKFKFPFQMAPVSIVVEAGVIVSTARVV
jgi:hypothetical protein